MSKQTVLGKWETIRLRSCTERQLWKQNAALGSIPIRL